MKRFLRAAGFSLVALALAALLWPFAAWPPPSWWRTHWPSRTAFMRLRHGELRHADRSEPFLYRPVALDSMSLWLPRAVMVGEDDAFMLHGGLDYRSLREVLGYRRAGFSWGSSADRAELLRAVTAAFERPDRLRGASTITQQLAKNLYLSPSRSALRKLKEAALAFRLEWALSKERILELYLNSAELGPNLWGVEAASREYFGRSSARVTIEQASLLAATLPHPLTSNPAHRPSRARWRQQLILRRLRGEVIQVPKVAEEDSAVPGDTGGGQQVPLPDSAPVPNDTAAAPAKDTAAVATPSSR